MDAVTYPTPRIVDFLHQHFACFTVDTSKPSAEGKELVRAYRLLFSPGFVFLDHLGNEVRRLVGYRSPESFLAELSIAKGLSDLLHTHHGDAVRHFQCAVDYAPKAETAPEALYWAAIAIYRRDGRDKGLLKEAWEKIRERYPESAWWQAADVFDVEPTGKR